MQREGNIIKDPLWHLSYTLSNGLACTLFGLVMVGSDRGLEKHLDINDRYNIASPQTIIQRVLSYSGCRGNGSSHELQISSHQCRRASLQFRDFQSRNSFSLLNVQIDRVGLIVLLLQMHLKRQWDVKLQAALKSLSGANRPAFFEMTNVPAALQKAFTDNWDGCDEKENHDLKEEYELILVIFKLCFWK